MLGLLFSIKLLTLAITAATAYIVFKGIATAISYQQAQISSILQAAGLE